MENSSLVNVFRTFSRKEVRNLHKWVRSPFFNQRQDVIDLLDYLTAHEQYSKPAAFAWVFPDKPYQDSLLRYAMSFLLKNIKAYLTWQTLEEQPEEKHLRLCRQWRQRSIPKLFEQEIAQMDQVLVQQPKRDANFHYYRFQQQLERLQWERNHSRSDKGYLQELLDEFTNYYLSELLRYGCTIQSYQQMSAEDFDLRIVELLNEKMESIAPGSVPAVAVYTAAYRALRNPGEAIHFERFKQIMAKDAALFSKEEQKDLHLLGINYCIQKLNRGQREYIGEALNFL
jgi:hypothetical protein